MIKLLRNINKLLLVNIDNEINDYIDYLISLGSYYESNTSNKFYIYFDKNI